ncbi:hypothetical protein AALO_G00132050 [Alosa alosa]|uniref:MOB kinase activator 3A n=1 Tax=Alosa alosa TaxID=278164 RepID=A0AAV6GRY7_9TELE|nr:hypothetical protein AALO_G00132050 [Alosa alosa]
MSLALKQVFNKDRTFRPKRKFEPGTQRFELHKKAQASLNAGLDLKQAVQLPHGEDLNDWVAVHVVDFFNRINLIYGTVSDSCTDQSCPVMSGGPKYEYRWQDENKYRKPTALSAPKYMNMLMDWIEVQINNEHIFPTNVGTPFPKTFMQVAKKILSRLFRVFVHVYIHHFDRVSQMGAEAHVNTCYKHFYYFVTEFNLTDHKELEPLEPSVCAMFAAGSYQCIWASYTAGKNAREVDMRTVRSTSAALKQRVKQRRQDWSLKENNGGSRLKQPQSSTHRRNLH